MKRPCFWTAAIFLASGGMAVASDSLPALVVAMAESDEMKLEGVVSPSDEPIHLQSPPTGPHLSGASFTPSGAMAGCGMNLQCCERVPTPLDNVWDGYCAQQSHVHLASSMFGLLHVQPRCKSVCLPPAPACDSCDCRLEWPKLRPMLAARKAPCGPEPCAPAPCETCPRPRRLLGLFRKPDCCESGCDLLPLDGHFASPDFQSAGDPGLTPPPPVAPPAPRMPELPAAASAPEAQGWLPLPWLKRLPL